MLTITGASEVRAKLGAELGVSPWHDVTQGEIDAFADATGDHNAIHVDPAAAAGTPLGTTIAHGLYTLSLGPRLTPTMFAIEGVAFALNYGYDRVRFLAPVPVGSRVRMCARLSTVEDVPGGADITITQTFEREGSPTPVCVADAVLRVWWSGGDENG